MLEADKRLDKRGSWIYALIAFKDGVHRTDGGHCVVARLKEAFELASPPAWVLDVERKDESLGLDSGLVR
jgi:hypothetical protein